MALRNGSLSYTQLCAANGVSIERMIAMRKRDNELLRAAGLPEIPGIDSTEKTAEINATAGQDAQAEEPVRSRFGGEVFGVN